MAAQTKIKYSDGREETITVTLVDMIKAEEALAARGKSASSLPIQAGVTGAYFACKRSQPDTPAFTQWVNDVAAVETLDDEDTETSDPFRD